MVMDIERTGNVDEMEEVAEEETVPDPGASVLDDIARLIESIARLGDYRRSQRKECYGLMRRLKLLLPLIEEIRDIEGAISETGVAGLRSLRKALVLSWRLLRTCNEGSKIYLVCEFAAPFYDYHKLTMRIEGKEVISILLELLIQALESEAVQVKFHAVYERLIRALDALPYDELGISDEVTEQMELTRVQLKRAKRRTDTQDIELAMDVMVVFSEKDNRNADSAIIERLAQKLDLHTPEDLKYETMAIRKLVKENGEPSQERIQQFVSLLNKFKEIVGVEVTNVLEEPTVPSRTLTKLPSLVIPHEFLCPITLEIMRDPVIIASGQTYERESIQKWLDSNHQTCPKTRQTLVHLSLASNFALKNLISQWCDKNNFQLPESKVPQSSGTETSVAEQRDEIESLVQALMHSQLEDQRKAVIRIRMLSKENPENRVLIAKCSGVPPLVQLLSYPDSKIKEHAVTALLNLSIDETNKKMIAKEGAIPAIIEVLRNGTTEARENSAAALFSLSMVDENKNTVGLNDGIPPLVKLLQNGTIRGKKDAATALFNLSLNQMNKARAIKAGIVPPLLQLLKDRNLRMIDEALSILYLLSSHQDGRRELGQLPFIETLVEFIREGTPKNKEGATSVLLELGSSNSSFMLAALQFGVYEHLMEITRSGTNRGQRKANALLQLMSKQEQIP